MELARIAVSADGTFGAIVQWHTGTRVVRLADRADIATHDATQATDVCFVQRGAEHTALVAFYPGHGVLAISCTKYDTRTWKRIDDQRVMSVKSAAGCVYVCARTPGTGCELTVWDFVTGWMLKTCTFLSAAPDVTAHTLAAFPLTADGSRIAVVASQMALEKDDSYYRSHTCFGILRSTPGNTLIPEPAPFGMWHTRIAHRPSDGIVDHGPNVWGVVNGVAMGDCMPGKVFVTRDTTGVHIAQVSVAPRCIRENSTDVWTLDAGGAFILDTNKI